MPPKDFKDFFANPSAICFCAKDGGEWKELPTLSEPPQTIGMDYGIDITPSNLDFSFTATMHCEIPKRLLRPGRLPRKLKKAAKTLYLARDGRSFIIKINPTPKTKRQRRIARKCAWGEIMTPKGEILTLNIQTTKNACQ